MPDASHCSAKAARFRRLAFAVICTPSFCQATAAAAKLDATSSAPYEPTAHYTRETLEGWTLRVQSGFARHAQLKADTLKVLGHQLAEIARVVPPSALARLRSVNIWVEVNEPHHPCMCYHPDAGWLRSHDMNPDKARCVEIANAETFLKWTIAQPWMVLHELSHAYHHQCLPGGYDNTEVIAVYKRALAAGRYGKVLYYNGGQRQSYAATNPQEFFAESSEAYFGTNDFYPFVQAELKQYDPATLDLMKKVWTTQPTASH